MRDKELKIGKQEIYFVADTRKSFQKQSKPTYGIFDVKDAYNDFHVKLMAYINDEVDFLTFTKKSMEYYENQIKKSAPATGAFVVFANYIYKYNKDRYLLIFSINNNNGYNFNEEELTIQQILNLDLSKLDVAALVNITKWQKFVAGDEKGMAKYGWQFSNLIAFIRLNIFVKINLQNWLDRPFEEPDEIRDKQVIQGVLF